MTRRLGRRTVVAATLVVLGLGGTPALAAQPSPVWGVDQPRTAVPGSDPVAGVAAPTAGATTSDAAATATSTSTWTLSGAGWGHGVGMSQYGAREMAVDGWSAADILGHYYTGTQYTKVTDTQRLYVNLRHGVSAVNLGVSSLSSGSGGMRIIAGGVVITGAPGATARVVPSGGTVAVSCPACTPATSVSGSTVAVYWDDDKTLLSVDGTPYRDGSVTVTRTPGAGTLEAVARVRLHDEYLDYIREVPWGWPIEALKAQAAAARGFAISAYERGLNSSCNCHVYDTVASQVFGGYPTSSGDLAVWPRWRQAVRATGSSTTGYVSTYDGAIIESVYSSSTGGRTQNSEDVWSAALPYLRSVDDHWSLRPGNPNASWAATPSRSSLASAFGLSDVARLDLSSRYVSGAVRTATATSSSGATASLSGGTFAGRLGLKSSYVQRPTTRFDGSNRYGVAASLAASRLPSATTVVIASGEDGKRADAAVGGPLAQAIGAPLLLARADSLPAQTRAELTRRSGTLRNAIVLGGSVTIGQAVVDDLEARGLAVTRIGGADRFAVSANVARRIAQVHPVTAAVVASGYALADALGAGGPAGAVGEVVLLTRKSAVPSSVSTAIADLGVARVRLLGSTASVDSGVEAALQDQTGSVLRIGGSDRYAVAANVATFYRPLLPDDTGISLACGEDRALTDAVTAGSVGQMMVLTRSGSLPSATVEVLQRSGNLAGVSVFGGTVSVSSGVEVAAARS